MDKKENIIKSSISTLSMIKRIYFIKNKKLKLSINKFYKNEERFLEEVKVIFIKIIKIYILVLIKDLIISRTISLK